MSDFPILPTRRNFLYCSVAGALPSWTINAGAVQANMPWSGPAVIRKVFLASQTPSWPRPDIDLKQEMAEIEAQLGELARRHPGELTFIGGELLREGTDISAWAQSAGDADVLLVFNVTSGLGPILEKVVSVGRPTVLFSRPYAGHSWSNFSTFAQKGRKAEVLATSDFGDLDPYVDLFRTIHHLRSSKVLLISPPGNQRRGEPYTNQFGTAFGYPAYADLKAAFDAADVRQARKLAEEFTKAAIKVVEPSTDEIVASMRLYLGIQTLLEREKANAISIDCLGGFRRGDLPAYPCVSFSKLNDTGMYGVCECDFHSTMTQLLVTSFSGKPGFVTDPVFDTSRNEVIHAHCVAATKMAGINGPASPYIVRSHMEDNKGVSMQVLMPVRDTVTVARFADATKMLVSTGEVTGNVDAPRGCRSKIRTRVKDARKFLEVYSSGLHRVLFYGDLVTPIERLGRLTGFQVVREG